MIGFKGRRFADCVFMVGSLVPSFILVFVLSITQVSAAGTARNYDQRIKQLESWMQNQNMLEMFNQLQSLQREVSELRGEMELLNHNYDEIKKQQKDIYMDLDQRIQALDRRLNSGATTVVPALVDVSKNDANDDQLALNEQEGYQAALGLLKKGRYEDAIGSFQIYLITYPASEYASNAQYWMAEAYYVLKDYQSAISHFNKVISAYPNSRKVPDAYLKVGFSYYEEKDWKNAQRALKFIPKNYASSTAARLAERRLKRMKQDGQL